MNGALRYSDGAFKIPNASFEYSDDALRYVNGASKNEDARFPSLKKTFKDGKPAFRYGNWKKKCFNGAYRFGNAPSENRIEGWQTFFAALLLSIAASAGWWIGWMAEKNRRK